MPRTTPELVGGIIEVDPSIPLTPFIETSSHIVTKWCAPHSSDNVELELTERYLAAHLYTLRDPRVTQEGVESIVASYQSKVDLGLDTSHYGQSAKYIDSTGRLARWDEQVKSGKGKYVAQLVWLGKTPEEVDQFLRENPSWPY